MRERAGHSCPAGFPDGIPSHEAVAEGINLYSEYSLHDALKRIAAGPEGRIEVPVGGSIADAVRPDGELVEIQTSHLGAIGDKLKAWLDAGFRVRMQVPLVARKTIVRIDGSTGEVLSRRKSPKKQGIFDLFDELVRASFLLSMEGLVIEVVFIESLELRRSLPEPVRRGRFLRSSETQDRVLQSIVERREFRSAEDWLSLLPGFPDGGWDSASLAAAIGIPAPKARKILYSLARAGLLQSVKGEGRRKRYGRTDRFRSA
jgi:hypothetical protein